MHIHGINTQNSYSDTPPQPLEMLAILYQVH
jgi:hypothetical protein